MELAVIAAALVLLALSVIFYTVTEHYGQRVAAKRRVVINLVDDRAITGVLWRRHRRLVVMRGAELVEPGREPVPMDGDVVIERDRISFTQIVGG